MGITCTLYQPRTALWWKYLVNTYIINFSENIAYQIIGI